jgi:hypothetical protein
MTAKPQQPALHYYLTIIRIASSTMEPIPEGDFSPSSTLLLAYVAYLILVVLILTLLMLAGTIFWRSPSLSQSYVT